MKRVFAAALVFGLLGCQGAAPVSITPEPTALPAVAPVAAPAALPAPVAAPGAGPTFTNFDSTAPAKAPEQVVAPVVPLTPAPILGPVSGQGLQPQEPATIVPNPDRRRPAQIVEHEEGSCH